MISLKPKRLDAIVVAETVKRLEASAPLDDAEANMQALATHSGREDRLLHRAACLGQRLGLQAALQSWHDRAGVVWIALALLVFLTGFGMVEALLGADRTINVVLAFVAALGIHLLMLVAWVLGLVAAYAFRSSRLSRFSLGNLALRLMAWTPSHRRPLAAQMLPAALDVLERRKLLPWFLGLISHTVWAAAFVLALLAMWFMFSFREYRLTWETTILEPTFFVGFVEVTGFLPRLLGFPVPDTGRLLDPGGGDHRMLAYWLIGCTFTYGLLPRALLAVLSWLVWRTGQQSLKLDTSDPYFRKLLVRFDEMDRPTVVDAEKREASAGLADARRVTDGRGTALIGFELPPECDWQSVTASVNASLMLNMSGAGDQSEEALHALRAAPPQRLLVVCDQAASPDRGTARFLRQSCGFAQSSAILLLPVRDQGDSYVRRWTSWLGESGLGGLTVFTELENARTWLGAQDE